jgi:hypothetical protein
MVYFMYERDQMRIDIIIAHADWLTEWGMLMCNLLFVMFKGNA